MKKIKGDRRRYAACGGEDRRQQLWAVIKKYCPLSSSIFFYLPLSSSIFFYLLLSTFFVACSGSNYSHEAAREAAEEFYSMLIKGNYKGFVEGYADAENMPEDFRRQLVDATAQFSDALAPRCAPNARSMAKDDMRSLVSVEAISDSLLEDSTAYVMLQLNFSDSTNEQIELPLVLMKEGWKMWTP